MRQTPHILVVNGTKVRRPVFIMGAPHSGTGMVARAVKRSFGFHLTRGRPSVTKMIYAFARRPSMAAESGRGAARVLRDAFAEAWRLAPGSCGECPAECRVLSGPAGPRTGRPCADAAEVRRFADATPDLIYSTDVLLDAFPDAQLVQVIRDGRDVVADMMADERCLAWFKPGIFNIDHVFPHPFLGVDEPAWRSRWAESSTAIKCALRWRGSVRLSAALRAQVPEEQLLTLRMEEIVADPAATAARLAAYLGEDVSGEALTAAAARHRHGGGSGLLPAVSGADPAGGWRERLTARQIAQVHKIAGRELERLGY
ncbi:sulfotransferase family protein [Actinocorallia herbida]|uniref:Sulfotransferase family protein n=1 Tax=Actinocorallia herbida TaxID=58109 RepID=A0A3N1CSA2_9ACTN|nr:sulfotransferase [Actinocorallia herbida]ROO84199.1 sulfotransferase family protein [Actinocorallia herbida]